MSQPAGTDPTDVLTAAVGPCYDTKGVAARLGLTTSEVDAQRHAGKILGAETSDRIAVFPTWQFSGSGVLPGFQPVLAVPRHAPRWTVALWAVTPADDLDGVTPLAWAEDDRPAGRLLTCAQRTATDWR